MVEMRKDSLYKVDDFKCVHLIINVRIQIQVLSLFDHRYFIVRQPFSLIIFLYDGSDQTRMLSPDEHIHSVNNSVAP